MAYRQTQPRKRRGLARAARSGGNTLKGLGFLDNFSWEGVGDFALDAYGAKQQVDAAEEQTEQAKITAETELEKLKTQRQIAQTEAEKAELDAQIRTARMQMIQEIAYKGIPVLLIGGGLLYFAHQKWG